MTREQKLDLVYRNTHPDFKGTEVNGERSIMVYRNGSTIVPLSMLTDKEIEDRLPRRRT